MTREGASESGTSGPTGWHLAGPLFAVFSGLSFSVSTVVGQAALEHGMSAAAVAGIRLLVGVVVLWLAVLAMRVAGVRPRRAGLLLATGTLTALQVLLLFEAIDRLGSSLAILLLFSYPPMVAAIAVATGRERMSRAKAVGIALSLLGMTLVIGVPGEGDGSLAGYAFGLGSGLALALYITAADRTAAGVNAFAATAWIQLGALLAITPIVLVRDSDPLASGVPWWTAVIGLASGTAALLFIMAVQRVTPTVASISSTIEPISTAILAAVLLDDVLTPIQLVGGVFIVSAVVAISRPSRPRRAGE